MSNASKWRQFATRPETVSWVRLRRHLDQMPGGQLVDLACDRMNETALIFRYASERFGVDLSDGLFRFNVENPNAPEAVLNHVLTYAEKLLGPTGRLPGGSTRIQ